MHSVSDNLLYGALIVACFCVGLGGYPPWVIVPLAAVSMIVFFTVKPQTLSVGWKERGLSFLALTLAFNCVLVAVPYAIGHFLAPILLQGR